MFINNQTPRMGYLALGQLKTGKLPDTPQSESGVIPNGTQPENTYSGDTPYTKEASKVYESLAWTNINFHAKNEATNKTPGNNDYEKEGEETTKTPGKNGYEKEGEETTKTPGNNYYKNEEKRNKPLRQNAVKGEENIINSTLYERRRSYYSY